MKAAEWEKIKSLFDAALCIPPEERSSWLNRACAGSPELLQTLEELIKSYEESSSADPRVSDAVSVFSPGQIVANRFRIIRLIARGGMGEVYEAEDASLDGLRVALKTIRTEIAREKHAYERFKREVWVAREVAHEGICRIFDLVEHRSVAADGTEVTVPCLTMQLLEGKTLESILSERRPLTPEEALPIIRQIVRALEVLHAKGIVHRDIKPSNIMLIKGREGTGDRAVIMDFGLAKPLDQRAMLWETRAEQGAGAPYFIAPEVLRGDKGGISVDVYSLGLVIDELVTRSPAFPNESIEELFWKKLNENPIPPSERSRTLPVAWEHAILRCLARDPMARPGSVRQVLDLIEGKSTATAETHHLLPPATTVPPEPPRISRRAWLAAIAVVALLPTMVAAVVVGDTSSIRSSLLVFPFVNRTHQSEYDFLCSGTADELMRRLTYVDGLHVFPVREPRSAGSPGLSQARYSLEGSLQKHADRVRLTVQLIDNKTGVLVWSEQYERELRDPLTLESEIAETMVGALSQRVRLEDNQGSWVLAASGKMGAQLRHWLGYGNSALPHQATSDPSAFEEYIHGRNLWKKRTVADTLAAIDHLQRAIAKDPKFALAYSALADCQHTLLSYNFDTTPRLLDAARQYAEKAVALDPALPETHVSLAAVRQTLWDWQGAEVSFQTALKVQPKFARAYQWHAGLLLEQGRFEDSLREARAGIELDPFDYPARSDYGLHLWFSGRVREAATHLEGLLQQTDLRYAHIILGQVYASLAASTSEPESTEFFVRSLRESGDVRTREVADAGGSDSAGFLKWSDLMYAEAHAARGDKASAQVYIDRLEHGYQTGNLPAALVACAQAAAGHDQRALELLQLGVASRDRELMNVKVIPFFRRLHGNVRFEAVLRQMGL